MLQLHWSDIVFDLWMLPLPLYHILGKLISSMLILVGFPIPTRVGDSHMDGSVHRKRPRLHSQTLRTALLPLLVTSIWLLGAQRVIVDFWPAYVL